MKKKILLFILVLILLSVSVIVSGNNFHDSLNQQLILAKSDTSGYRLLETIINEYLDPGSKKYNPDTIGPLLDRAVEQLRFEKDIKRLGQFFHLKGIFFIRKKQLDQADYYLDSSIYIAGRFRDYRELGSLYLLKEMVCRLLHLNERRVQSLYKAIENFRKSGSLEGQAGAYFNLGNIYSANQQNELAIQSFLLGAETRNKLNDSIGAGINYLFCAAVCMKQNNLAAAGDYIKRGRAVIHSSVAFQPLYYYIIYGRWLKAMDRKEEALNNFERAIRVADKGNQRYQIPVALCEMAEIYIDRRKFGKAREMLEEAMTISGREKFLSIKIMVRKVFSEYFEAVGNPLKALDEYKMMQALKDSSSQTELSKALTGSAMEAEYNRKEAEREEQQRIQDEKKAQKLRRHKTIAFSSGIFLLFSGTIASLLFRSFRRKKKANRIITAEKKRSDDLLKNILPDEVAQELKITGISKARDFRMVTVLFTDFKNFTALSERLSAPQLVDEIHYLYSAFDEIVSRNRIEKIKTIGDSYMCAGGIPVENATNPEDTVKAALEMRDFIDQEKQKRSAAGQPCFEIRIGVHTGPVVAGIVGTKKFAYDIWGDTVNIASRMESSGEPGKVNISSTTYEWVKDHYNCHYRGKIEAKNKGLIDMYFVE